MLRLDEEMGEAGSDFDIDRKKYPVYTGVLKYFPDALMEVSRVSLIGNEQHHAGKPLHWDKTKSTINIFNLIFTQQHILIPYSIYLFEKCNAFEINCFNITLEIQ